MTGNKSKNIFFPTSNDQLMPKYQRNFAILLLLALAYFLRSYGGFYRFPSNGDEFFIISHAMRLREFLVSGNMRSFVEGIFDFYSRPTTYVFNMAGALINYKAGMYFIYSIYGIISLAVLYMLSLKNFGRYEALGTLALGVFTAIHINYSMKLRSSMPCFMLISGSIYFFIQSHYGNNRIRDKIISALLVGIAFTAHNSAGPIPFIYIITEFFIYVKEKSKRDGFKKRFFLLLIFMALPIILWETVCFVTIHTGEITSPYFRHYLKKLIFHENLGIPEKISAFYFMYVIFRLESIFFLALVGMGVIGSSYLQEKRQRIFFFMAFILTGFYTFFSRLACMPRSIFPLYIFLIPIGGFGFSIVFRGFEKRSKKLAYVVISAILLILYSNSLTVVRTIRDQQKIPIKMFNFLKDEGVSRFIMGKSFALSVPYLKKVVDIPKVMRISDPEGYEIYVYFSHFPEEILRLAKEKDIKYLQTNYLDYDLNPRSYRHFMFDLHEMGLGRPTRSWAANEYDFPMTFLEEEPFKVQEYDRLYAKRKSPFNAEDIVYRTMLYDLSKLREKL